MGVLKPPTWKNDVVCITGLFRSLLIIWVLAKLKKFCCPKWLWHIPLGDPVVPEVQNITQVSVFVSWAWNGSGALFSLVISNLASMFWTPVTTPRLNRCTVWLISASTIAMASLALLAVSSTHMTSLAFVSVNCKKQEWNPMKHLAGSTFLAETRDYVSNDKPESESSAATSGLLSTNRSG